MTTIGAPIKSTTDGNDFYFFVLEKNADWTIVWQFLWPGWYAGFGAEHVDGGTSRFDPNGVIYQALCANCGRDVQLFLLRPVCGLPNNGSPNVI